MACIAWLGFMDIAQPKLNNNIPLGSQFLHGCANYYRAGFINCFSAFISVPGGFLYEQTKQGHYENKKAYNY
jgi:hypothetical protein